MPEILRNDGGERVGLCRANGGEGRDSVARPAACAPFPTGGTKDAHPSGMTSSSRVRALPAPKLFFVAACAAAFVVIDARAGRAQDPASSPPATAASPAPAAPPTTVTCTS